MQTLSLVVAVVAILIGGVLVERRSYGSGAATLCLGLIMGMMAAAQMVMQTIITFH